jgi:protein tyrosine/serine phosphatase
MTYIIRILMPLLFAVPTFASTVQDLPNFVQVKPQIFRGGRPTSDGLRELQRRGVKTIVDIENDGYAIAREKTWATELGIKFISSPMDWRVAPSDQQIESLLQVLKDKREFPVYLHCKHGEDRTGLVFGLYRVVVDGWSVEDAYDEMLKLHFHPEYKALDQYFYQRVLHKPTTHDDQQNGDINASFYFHSLHRTKFKIAAL